MHYDRGIGDAKPSPADVFGHGDAEPAALGHGLVKFCRKPAVFFSIGPVLVIKTGANPADIRVDRRLLDAQLHVHGGLQMRAPQPTKISFLPLFSPAYSAAIAPGAWSMPSAISTS